MHIDFTLEYILSQIFTIVSYVMLCYTYQLKSRNKILIVNFISLIATGISYLLLHAYSGLAMVIVAIIRNIIFYYDKNKEEKKHNTKDIIILGILFTISIVFAYFTYNGFLSLMSVFATMMYTFSVWQKNPTIYKFLGIPIEIIWIIYNIYIKSIFGIILEICLFISIIIGILKKNKN